MTNSVDPDQTAPIGAVCSGSTLFASILEFVINVWQLFGAEEPIYSLAHTKFGRLRSNCLS